jgi:hypothetical protein
VVTGYWVKARVLIASPLRIATVRVFVFPSPPVITREKFRPGTFVRRFVLRVHVGGAIWYRYHSEPAKPRRGTLRAEPKVKSEGENAFLTSFF